eukprot:c24998_g1_i1 orf=273-1361(-)
MHSCNPAANGDSKTYQDNCLGDGDAHIGCDQFECPRIAVKRRRLDRAAVSKMDENTEEKETALSSVQERQECGVASMDCRSYRKKGGIFIYGNYAGYYGYRLDRTFREDPRLKHFKKQWFEGKDCLDVGCHEGYLTIAIVQEFSCKSMLGVDIDRALVGKAKRHLEIKARVLQTGNEKLQYAEDFEQINVSSCEESASMDSCDIQTCCSSGSILQRTNACTNVLKTCLSGEELMSRVKFKTENFIQSLESDAVYDTVLCLSVTKWIHLNWGDQGLIRLFAKIFHLLRPGGLLVLEPQPWKSYKGKQHVSEVAQRNFKEVALRPSHFPELLLDKIGFRFMDTVTDDVPNTSKGFNRPIFLLYK